MKNSLELPQAAALVRDYSLFPAGSTVLLAVSGGRDSMALLHWAYTHAEEFGIGLAVGHYHHGMRGEAADADQTLVDTWCLEHNVPFYTDRANIYEEAALRGLGVEETGRELRYSFLNGLADRLEAAVIATAHNADDNAETLLLHLTRGSGLQGLTGIPIHRGRLVRPLLTTTRAEIDRYVAEHAIPYGEDATNTDEAFARNRIRHQVTPVLKSLNPRYVESAAETIRLLREDHAYLEAQAAALCDACRPCAEGLLIPAATLAARPAPIASRAVRQLLVRLTGQTDFRRAHLDAVLALAASDDPSAELALPYGVTVRRVYSDLLITDQPLSCPISRIPLQVGENTVGDWAITVSGEAEGLIVRSRQSGDTIRLPKQPTKTLKKLFIEKKFPRHQRDALPIVCDEAGVVAAALLGPNIDHPLYGRVTILFTPISEKEG